MKKHVFIVLSLVIVQLLPAQQDPAIAGLDPAARKILDKLASQAQADYPVKVSFDYTYESLPENQHNTESGTLVLQQDKFRLSVGETDVFCDGKTVWNHMESVNEVYISDPEENNADDEFFLSNPSDLFTFYQEGFKYRLTRELSYEGNDCYEIDLFPNDLNKSYHTIKLLISKKDHRLLSAQALGKQGDNHTVMLKNYQKKVSVTESTFVFNTSSHPGVEVVDTRF
ncbi:MAG: outer membrane lipoprotein carrier protein LolA [Bacteroidales bacterium]|nr:outer membrane lipoprotein carrier protein LolA [Bacteroidales bacterium]